MIAYLQGKDTTVEVPDSAGDKELNDIQQNFAHYVQPAEQGSKTASPASSASSDQKNTVALPNQAIPTGIPGLSIPTGKQEPITAPNWVPNFYEGYIKPFMNTLPPPLGAAIQLEEAPEKVSGPATAAIGGFLKGSTMGLLSPMLDPITGQEEKDHPVYAGGGQMLGGLGSLLTTGGALRIAGLGEVAEEAGARAVTAGFKAGQRFIPRTIMSGATFGTQAFVTKTIQAFHEGNVDPAEFGKDILINAGAGVAAGGVGGIANIPASVATAATIGFSVSKMEGGSNLDAGFNAVMWASFEAIGSYGKSETLIKEGMNNVVGAVDNYIKAQPETSGFDPAHSREVAEAVVNDAARKVGGLDGIKTKEDALQAIEEINQRIRQGKVRAPIQEMEARPKLAEGAEPAAVEPKPEEQFQLKPDVAELQQGKKVERGGAFQTEHAPNLPSPTGQETYPAGSKVPGGIFPQTEISSQPSIAEHPDFKLLTNDASAVVNKYAQARGVEPTLEFADKLKSEFHDKMHEFKNAGINEAFDLQDQIKEQYPDIEREYSSLWHKLWTDKTGGWFEKNVAGNYDHFRPKVGIDAENASRERNQVAKVDSEGVPVRKPGSVVSIVTSKNGERTKITHQMILDEAEGLRDRAKEQDDVRDPLLQFVKEHGGVRGFKGFEQEEFKGVPLQARGQTSLDEMAQMAFDRGLLEESSSDLLRFHLSNLKPREAVPSIGDLYNEAQRELEKHFSGLGGEEDPGDYFTRMGNEEGMSLAERSGSYAAPPSPDKINLYIIHHGTTDIDAQGKNHGDINAPLNEKGISEAHGAAKDLRGIKLSKIVSPDLARSTQTAQPIAESMGISVQEMPNLRPLDIGEFGGKQIEDIRPSLEKAYEGWAKDPNSKQLGNETFAKFQNRQLAALKDIFANAKPGDQIGVVANSDTDQYLKLWAANGGKPLEGDQIKKMIGKEKIDPGTISSYQINPALLGREGVESNRETKNTPSKEKATSAILGKAGEASTGNAPLRLTHRALQESSFAVRFKKTGSLLIPNQKIQGPEDLAFAFKAISDPIRENFFLGAIKDGRIAAVEHIGFGTTDQVAVFPFETLNVINHSAADSFFIGHNHPSGAVKPSEEDLNLTRRIREVLGNQDVKFLGHVIIDDTKFGFIHPDGSVQEITHKEFKKTKKIDVLQKYGEWTKARTGEGVLISSPSTAFELFKGVQIGKQEGVAYLLNIQNTLLNSIVIPHGQFTIKALQKIAADYRSPSMILVNSALDNSHISVLKNQLNLAGIHLLDSIEQKGSSFESKTQMGLFDPKGEYAAKEQGQLFEYGKENVADQYERLRQQAISQGMNPLQASRWAKAQQKAESLPAAQKPKQAEFGSAGGVEGFGQGRKGEQSLFEKGSAYGPTPESLPLIAHDFKESYGEIKNLLSPSSAAPFAAAVTREDLGQMARAHDKAEATLSTIAKFFESQNNEHNIDFIDRVEHGVAQPDADLEKIATVLRKLLDLKRQEVQDLGTGKLQNFIENYFPHIWDQSEGKVSNSIRKAAKRPIEGSKAFLKKRKIEFTKQGIEIGLTPVSYNPVELVLLKMREMDKYIMAHQTLNTFKEQGLAKFIKVGEDVPVGFKKLDDRISTIMFPTDKGLVISGHYYVQEDAARIINNYLSPGLQKSKVFQLVRTASNALNQAQLSLSAFHAGFVVTNSFVGKTALALDMLERGHPIKAIEEAVKIPFAPIADVIRGDKLAKAWKGQGNGTMETMANAMASAGGRARMDQFFGTRMYEQIKKHFKSGELIRGVLKTPLAAIDLTSKPVLEWMVPRMKMGAFADIMRMEMENNPNMTHEEKREIGQRAWDSIDNRLGQVVYDNKFWDRSFKDILHLTFRSVGWNSGTVGELGGGAVDIARGDFSYRANYLIALPIVMSIVNLIYQYLKTGQGPKELADYVFPKKGGEDRNGHPLRSAFPSYEKDVYHFAQAPVQTVVNKLNPLLSILYQMYNNKDFYGERIRNEGDPLPRQVAQEAAFIIKQFESFSIRNMRNVMAAGGKTLADILEPWVGVTPAPYDVNWSPAEKMAHAIALDRIPQGGRTQAQIEHSRLMNKLEREYRSNDPKAREDMDAAFKSGKITDRQFMNIVTGAKLTPLQRITRSFSAEELERVYEKANEEEKAQLEPKRARLALAKVQ